MAERLTERKKIKGITYTIQPHIENNLVIHKLGLLEDILKKYGIESVEELDKKLANFDNFMKGNKFKTIEDLQNALNGKFIEVFDEKNKIWQDMVKNLTKTEKDRDTWKKACELACKHIAEVEWLSCPETDDIKESENEIKTLTSQSLNYFYQRAKKEGENNDTNN